MNRMLTAFMEDFTQELLKEHTNYSVDERKVVIAIAKGN